MRDEAVPQAPLLVHRQHDGLGPAHHLHAEGHKGGGGGQAGVGGGYLYAQGHQEWEGEGTGRRGCAITPPEQQHKYNFKSLTHAGGNGP